MMFPGRVDPKAIYNIKQIALIIYTDVYKYKKKLLQNKLFMKLHLVSKVHPSIFFKDLFSVNGYLLFNSQIINL